MDSFKTFVVVALVSLFGCFICAIDYYMQSNTYQERAYDSAILAFDSADNVADKLQALSIMHNLDKQAFHGVKFEKIEHEHRCMYRMAQKYPVTTKYSVIFWGCLNAQ